ncbi:MAG: hypothetical protein RL085_915, partial [Actinomycetota bacterium]
QKLYGETNAVVPIPEKVIEVESVANVFDQLVLAPLRTSFTVLVEDVTTMAT